MPPRATAFEGLAPDQRAAVELVLRQGRSYGELADLLGLSEDTIRARARGGLEALAPDLPPPARAAEVADWLLGQQAERHAARTRELLSSDPATRRWAETVAAPLRELYGDDIPTLPPAPERAGGAAEQRPPGAGRDASAAAGDALAPGDAAARPGDALEPGAGRDAAARPGDALALGAETRDGAATGDALAADGASAQRRGARRDPGGEALAGEGAAWRGGEALAAESAAPARSSRLGGALLLGGVVVVVAAVLAFVFLRGGDDSGQPAAATTPAATATATATAAQTGNDLLLRGPAGSKAVGLMRLFQANDGTVRFALAAQGVPPNRPGETYSLWFRKKSGSALLLGAIKNPVTSNGELTSAGPGNEDVSKFPTWFATYDNVLVTRDGKQAKEPGTVILSGELPHAQGG